MLPAELLQVPTEDENSPANQQVLVEISYLVLILMSIYWILSARWHFWWNVAPIAVVKKFILVAVFLVACGESKLGHHYPLHLWHDYRCHPSPNPRASPPPPGRVVRSINETKNQWSHWEKPFIVEEGEALGLFKHLMHLRKQSIKQTNKHYIEMYMWCIDSSGAKL